MWCCKEIDGWDGLDLNSMARIKDVGDKGTLLCKWCKGMLERIFGKDCGRFGGIGFDGFEASGIFIFQKWSLALIKNT